MQIRNGDAMKIFKVRWLWFSILCLLSFTAFFLTSKLGTNEKIPPVTMFYLLILGSLPVALILLITKRFKLEKSAKGIFNGTMIGLVGGVGQLALLIALADTSGNT